VAAAVARPFPCYPVWDTLKSAATWVQLSLFSLHIGHGTLLTCTLHTLQLASLAPTIAAAGGGGATAAAAVGAVTVAILVVCTGTHAHAVAVPTCTRVLLHERSHEVRIVSHCI
jgi:hypothetical protein